MNDCHTNREFENTWEGMGSRRSVGDIKSVETDAKLLL